MAEESPKKERRTTDDSPNEASPHSAKHRQQQQTGTPTNTMASDEPPTPNDGSGSVEEEEETVTETAADEIADDADDRVDDGELPRPLPPPNIGAAGESGRQKAYRRRVKRVMEYDVSAMYPEVQLLVDHKRKEWNYSDPKVIRALFLEAKTNALGDWKVGRAIIAKRKKPLIEVQETIASKLRRQHLDERRQKLMEQHLQEERERHYHGLPEFAERKLATNSTTHLRYHYTRNNPPVPHYFMAHYERFKKPPFVTYGLASKGCCEVA